MTDFTTGAGATFGLTAAAPATYNQAGYEALAFTEVGKVTDFGQIPSRVYEVVKLMYLASAGTDKAKGGYDLGTQTITVALDGNDAGQILLAAATNSISAYSIKLHHPVLGTIYARALVMGGPKAWGNNSTASTWQVTIEYKIASATEDGVVTVAA